MKNFNLKARLATMNFLEFAVWGAYLISMGMFLGTNGLGEYVFWFYTVQGLVSIFMPALIGIIADRWIPAQITLSLCHLLAGGFMIACGYSSLRTACRRRNAAVRAALHAIYLLGGYVHANNRSLQLGGVQWP